MREPTSTMERNIRVESAAFEDGATIPEEYSSEGGNVSPPLSWSPGPAGTSCYALIVDDPDAPSRPWVHWTAWNLTANRLDEDASAVGRTPTGAVQGLNSWNRSGWGGPMPPSGTHRYRFRVFALDGRLDLDDDADRATLERAMLGHVLAVGELVGKFSAKK